MAAMKWLPIAVIALLLAASACSSSDTPRTAHTPAPPVLASCILLNLCPGQTPDQFSGLTEQEARDSALIAGGDERVSSLTSGRDYHIFSYAPWIVDQRQVGSLMLLDFTEPFAVDADFPYADDTSPTDATPYVEKTAHYDFDTRELIVLVDLSARKVVEVTPVEYEPHEGD
jgi:hypothetical protein